MFDVTKAFIDALKSADRAISVYMEKAPDPEIDERFKVTIRCTASIKAKAPAGFTVDAPGHFAEATAGFTYRDSGPIADGYTKASFVTLYPQGRGGWGALALILKPGDILSLVALDNTSGNLKERDLHADTLFAIVTRKGRAVIDQLPLEYSGGCPDNSARSLKR